MLGGWGDAGVVTCAGATMFAFVEITVVAGTGPVDRFRQNMPVNRFPYVSARLESVGRWFHVQLGVQRIKLKD
jgi:hypothetical protein